MFNSSLGGGGGGGGGGVGGDCVFVFKNYFFFVKNSNFCISLPILVIALVV